uniref:Sensor protein n=1 Tax=Streptomyces kanamyceticus TaxID=1967 RepID=E9KTE5_STRKN|nr:sensor protein [Streptomyces kanamyceticus]
MRRTGYVARRTGNGMRRLAPRTLRGRLSLVALATAALLMTVLTVVFNAVMDEHL